MNDSWILIKKFVPFGGLGSFAKIVDKDPNCIIVHDGPIVSLRAIKIISFGEEITFVPYKTSISQVIIEDQSIIQKMLREIQKERKTRSDFKILSKDLHPSIKISSSH